MKKASLWSKHVLMSLTDHQGHQSSERQSTVHATNSRYSWIPPYHQTNCCHRESK
ncbi:hypothetical protein LEMLEM_LOCUS6189 [Lemmus lemmus]